MSVENILCEIKSSDKLKISFASPEKGQEVDSLDASNEESFTLETFAELIGETLKERKSFIIAQTTTISPGNNSATNYSYYRAYDLNKSIFRIDIANHLLVKLESLNPLDNMPIKSIKYFEISDASFQACFAEKPPPNNSINDLRRSKWPDIGLEEINYDVKHGRSFSDSSFYSVRNEAEPNTPTVKRDVDDWLLIKSKYLGTDSDFLEREDFRKIFYENILKKEDFELFAIDSSRYGHNNDPVQTWRTYRTEFSVRSWYVNQVLKNWKKFIFFHFMIVLFFSITISVFIFLPPDLAIVMVGAIICCLFPIAITGMEAISESETATTRNLASTV